MRTIPLVRHAWPARTNRGPAVVTTDIIIPRTLSRKTTVCQPRRPEEGVSQMQRSSGRTKSTERER